MKIDYFHIDTMMILDNVTYRISRITENNQCVLEKLADLSLTQKNKDELLRLYQAGNLAFRSDITRNQTNQNMVYPDDNQIFHEYYCYIQAAQRKLGNKPTTVGLNGFIADMIAMLFKIKKEVRYFLLHLITLLLSVYLMK